MGSYGIGIERLAAAIIEAYHDENGIVWPWSVTPFHVVVTPVSSKDTESMDKAQELYEQLLAEDYQVLFDDRDERPGVKFKDADLIGIPLRLVVGAKGLKKGVVEVIERLTGKREEVPFDNLVEDIQKRVIRLTKESYR